MDPADQIVRPRHPATNAARPIVVVIDDEYVTEDGECGTTSDLIASLRHMRPSIIVYAGESAALLQMVQARWGACHNFNFRVAPVEREIFAPNNPRKLVHSLTSVAWFGWKEKPGRHDSIRNRYHLLIDPVTFSGAHLDRRTFAAHMDWMREIREFCIEQGWNLKPTQGGVARQALRDPRFYPKPRRKVPRATNDRVREHLPGNHYQLTVTPSVDKEYHAEYYDQTKCHHFHATETPLPDSDTLYGYGRFRRPGRGRATRTSPDRVQSFLEGFSGMVYGSLRRNPHHRARETFLPKYLEGYEEGTNTFFYTADLDLLASVGYAVDTIVAAWGSYDRDTGIRRYAKWALQELGSNPPGWKKRLLLAPYGSLATTARTHSVGYHHSKGGKEKTLRTRSGIELTVKYHETTRIAEPSTNNVLHRALIEASNRAETLMFANYLESQGYTVLCIYVDAVIVERDKGNGPVPVFHPWRLDQTLTGLRFLSESQFVANETERLPGITGAQRKQYLSRGTIGAGPKLGSKRDQWERANRSWLKRF